MQNVWCVMSAHLDGDRYGFEMIASSRDIAQAEVDRIIREGGRQWYALSTGDHWLCPESQLMLRISEERIDASRNTKPSDNTTYPGLRDQIETWMNHYWHGAHADSLAPKATENTSKIAEK